MHHSIVKGDAVYIKKYMLSIAGAFVAIAMIIVSTGSARYSLAAETHPGRGDFLYSPFGVSGAYSRPFLTDEVSPQDVIGMTVDVKDPYGHALNIGSRWVRPGFANLLWKLTQPTAAHLKNELYDWGFADRIYGRVPRGMHTLFTVSVSQGIWPGTWQFVSAEAEKSYLQFIRALVERYDGDGKNDMPGLMSPVKHWQVDNEPMTFSGLNMDWQGFGHIVEITYRAIKEADPEATVALGGLAGGEAHSMSDPLFQKQLTEFYFPLLRRLQGRYIDIFDIHYYGTPAGGSLGWQGMKDIYSTVRRALDENGYSNTEIWFTETATASRPDDERAQAGDLVKRFIFPLSFGAAKVFWWNMIEGEHPLADNKPSDHFGLVYDGVLPADLGYGVKKLSYYTYKKIIDVLEGSDWKSIKAVQESDGIFIYRMRKQGQSVWVAWNENHESTQVRIRLDRGATAVRITEAVPKYTSGKEVTDYRSAFRSVVRNDLLESTPPQLALKLGSTPVFVEVLP